MSIIALTWGPRDVVCSACSCWTEPNPLSEWWTEDLWVAACHEVHEVPRWLRSHPPWSLRLLQLASGVEGHFYQIINKDSVFLNEWETNKQTKNTTVHMQQMQCFFLVFFSLTVPLLYRIIIYLAQPAACFWVQKKQKKHIHISCKWGEENMGERCTVSVFFFNEIK